MNILKNKYLANSAWLILEQVFLMLASFTVGVFMVRYLGKEEYGFYSYLISLFIIFEVFCTFGQNNIVVKEIVKDKEKTEQILATAFRFQIVGGIGGFIILLITLFFSDYSFYDCIKFIIVFAAIPIKSFRVISFFFDARLLGRYNATIRTAVVIITNLLKIAVVFLQAPVIYFYIILVIDSILYSTFYIYYYRKQKGRFSQWKFNSALFKSFLKSGLLLMLSTFLITIYLRIDQIMITNILGNVDNGLYSAAVRISSSWYSLGWVAILSLFPALIKYKEKNEEIFKERMIYLIQIMLSLSLIIGIFFSFFSETIIEFLFTKDFIRSAVPLRIHIWSSSFIFLYFIQEKWYVINGKERLFVIGCVAGLILNCTLNWFTLKVYGIDSAAYNTLIGLFFSIIVFPSFIKETRELFILQFKAIITLHKFQFFKILYLKK